MPTLKGGPSPLDSDIASPPEEDFFAQDASPANASSGEESLGDELDFFSDESGVDEKPAENSEDAFEMPGTKNGGLKDLVDEITEGGGEGIEELSDDMIDSLLDEVELGDISPESDFGDIEMPDSETGLEENGLRGLEGIDDSFEELLGEASPSVEDSSSQETAQKPEAKDDIFSEMDNVFDSLMGEGEEESTPKETSTEETGSLEDFSFDEPHAEETAQPEAVDLGSDFDEMFGEGPDVKSNDDEKTGTVDAKEVEDRGGPSEESSPPSSEDTSPLSSGSALEDLDTAFGEMFGEDSASPASVPTGEGSGAAAGGGPAWEENLLDSLMKETEAEGSEDATTKMISTPPPPGTKGPEAAEEGMSEEDLWASALQEQKAASQGEDETTKAAEAIGAPSSEATGAGGDLVSQGDLDQLFAEATGGADEGTGPTQAADWGGGGSSGKTEIINQSELDNLWNQALAEQSDTGEEEKKTGGGDKPESTGIVSQEELDGLFSGGGQEDKGSQAGDQEPTEDLTAQTEMMEVREEKTSALADKGGGEEEAGRHEGEEEFEFDEELLTDKKKASWKDKISVAYITGLLPEGKKRYMVLSLAGVLLLGGIGTAGYFGYRHYSQPPIAGKEKAKEIIQEAGIKKEPAAPKQEAAAPKVEEAVKKEEKPTPEAPPAQEQMVKEQSTKEEPPPVQTAETAPQVPISEKNSLELGLIMPIQFSPTEMKVLQATFVFETRDHQTYEHLKVYLPIYQELMEKFANEFFNENFYNEIHYAKDKFKDKLMATFNKEMKKEAITRVEARNFVIDLKEDKKKTEEKKKDAPEGEKHGEKKGTGH